MKLESSQKGFKSSAQFVTLLVLAVVVAYMPVYRAGYIWDDDAHLTNNACVVGPAGFSGIWTSSAGVYYPLVLSTFWVVHSIWGLEPLPYHLLNVLLHAANALLVWRVLLALGVQGARWGAVLWALHPVMVQSVAWVTELKNTQSCFFYLLSILCFLKFHRSDSRRGGFFALSLFLFLLAVTSKTSTVMLPVVLASCVWWREGRWRWRSLLGLAPFFFVSAAASAWTIWEQKFHSGALGPEWVHPWPERIVIAGYDLWFYLGKLLWPHPLIFIYPRWEINAARLSAFLPALAAAGALLALWIFRNKRARPFSFAAAYFVASLFPVLGFFSVYFFRYSFVSDHFQYLASIGPLALAGAGVALLSSRLQKINAWLAVLPAAIPLIYFFLSARQAAIYADGPTLYRSIVAANQKAWMAYNNLGNLELQSGNPEEAIRNFQAALRARPGYSETLTNLGQAYFYAGRVDDAIAHYSESLSTDPRSAATHYNMGEALFQKGEIGQAISHYEEALVIEPAFAQAHNNLGNALLQTGQPEDAMTHYRAALSAKPDYAEAHFNYAGVLSRTGEIQEAVAHYQRAVELKPDFLPALTGLAWILATSQDGAFRDGTRAISLAKQADQITGSRDAVCLGTLAAAYAEAGKFPDALESSQQAIDAAKNSGDAGLVQTLEMQNALFQQHIPVRTP